MMLGVDISKWQNVGAGDGADFVIIKATEGDGYTDPNCDKHYQRAKANGQLRGVYHFARPDLGNSAKAEADWFVSQIQGYIKDAILILDWERSTWNTAWALDWLKRVEELTGVKPLIYMSASVVTSYSWLDVVNNSYGLWIAGYPPEYNVREPGVPTPEEMPYSIGNWPFWVIWQYTSSAGTLDRDITYIDATTWAKYAGYYKKNEYIPEPVPVPEEPEEPEIPDVEPEPEPVVEPAKKDDFEEYEKAMKKIKKGKTMPFTLPTKLYEALRWIIAIVLPATGLFLELLNNVWGFGLPMDAIKSTLNGVAVFVGTIFCIGYANNKKNNG